MAEATDTTDEGDSTERTMRELVVAYRNGAVGIGDADNLVDLDGATVQAEYECADGTLTLTYGLDPHLTVKEPEGEDQTEMINLYDEK